MVILKLEQNYQLGMASGLLLMLGSNIDKVGWPKCGEIDILEYVGENQILFYFFTHTGQSWKYNQHKKNKIEDIEEGYHIYAMDWSKDKIDFFVDNNLVYTFNPENKTEAFGLIINPSFFYRQFGNWRKF
jgi:beta-glucanase (GH16 family)